MALDAVRRQVKMDTDKIFHAEIALWSGRDLAALKAALESSWKDCGMGLFKKEGFANRAKCVICNDGSNIEIKFESEKYITENSVSDEVIVPIGAEGGVA